ncbi:unnamed protein product [Diplocarpon coronariae]
MAPVKTGLDGYWDRGKDGSDVFQGSRLDCLGNLPEVAVAARECEPRRLPDKGHAGDAFLEGFADMRGVEGVFEEILVVLAAVEA